MTAVVEHADLGAVFAGWVAAELTASYPEVRVNYHAGLCVHPQLPPPHVGLVVCVAVPSIAVLGTSVSHVAVLPWQAATEAEVRGATREATRMALQQRSTQLAESRAETNGWTPP